MDKYLDSEGKKFEPIKVGSKGTLFELLVSRLEKHIINDESVQVEHNISLKNLEGFERQFDVWITSKVGSYPIQIVMECKQYGRDAIGPDKIEAFACKCQRVPTIDKMVFVSQSGYTPSAQAAAKVYGITLLDINELEDNSITSIIKPIKFKIQKRYIRLVRAMCKAKDYSGFVITDFADNTLYFDNKENEIPLIEFGNSVFINMTAEEWKQNFAKTENREQPTNTSVTILPDLPMYVQHEGETKEIVTIIMFAQIYEENSKLIQTEQKTYKEIDSDDDLATFIELEEKDNKMGARGELIISPDNNEATLNYFLIEDKKIICSNTNTYNLDNLVSIVSNQ